MRRWRQRGEEYYEFRAALMVRNNEGLTKTYNRFHDPQEPSPDILSSRDLHAPMDRPSSPPTAGPTSPTACDFILDYEEDDEDENARRRRGKSPGATAGRTNSATKSSPACWN